MRFYLLLFERDPRKSYIGFHADLTTSPNVSTWLHYLTNAYVLGTGLDEGALAELVQKLLVKHSLRLFFLIVAVDLDHFAGFLPNAAWNWLHENSIKADLAKVHRATSGEAKKEGENVAIGFRVVDLQKVAVLRGEMGRDLETLEQLATNSTNVGRDAAERGWIIVQENIVKTAEVMGFSPVESTDSKLKQAVYYLTGILSSQNIMIAAYGLAAALQKLKNNPDDKTGAVNAEHFVMNCMATIAELRLQLDKAIEQG
jgi:hypothetical protein